MSGLRGNETKRQAIEVVYQVDECRSCGRSFRFLGHKRASSGEADATGRCAKCGWTNPTSQVIAKSEVDR